MSLRRSHNLLKVLENWSVMFFLHWQALWKVYPLPSRSSSLIPSKNNTSTNHLPNHLCLATILPPPPPRLGHLKMKILWLMRICNQFAYVFFLLVLYIYKLLKEENSQVFFKITSYCIFNLSSHRCGIRVHFVDNDLWIWFKCDFFN